MPSPQAVPAALIKGPFGRAAALTAVTQKQLQGPSYDRLARGVYDVASRPREHRELIMGMRAVLPPDVVLGGRSAAWALGVFTARRDEPVEVVLPPDRRVRPRDQLIVRGDVLQPGEIIRTSLGLATTGARTAFDVGRRVRLTRSAADALCRQLSQRQPTTLSAEMISELCDHVALVDSVLRATGDPVSVVQRLAREHPRARGSRALRAVLALADPRAESPPESVLRTRIILAGLPAPIPQYPVLGTGGEFVARVDLGWPQWRLAAEYDGSHHNERRQFNLDRARRNRLEAAGWSSLHLDAAHLHHPERLLTLLHQTLQHVSATK